VRSIKCWWREFESELKQARKKKVIGKSQVGRQGRKKTRNDERKRKE
jgi:hypothetical protein